ncbi:MAG: cellulose binding domain-containing protein, partial [Balneolaceae bacterium]
SAAEGYEITFNADQSGVADAISNAFDVIPADPEEITILTQPANTPTGSPVSGPPAVQLVDSYQNPVSGVDITVSLNQNSFASGTTTVSTDSEGTASFSDLVITTIASGYQLTFDADASGVSDVSSSTFQITADAPDALEVTVQPTESTGGVTISPAPTILVKDSGDNPVGGVNVTVTLNKNNFAAGSTTVVTSNSNGLAVFNNLKINSADTGYEMSFSATGVSSATSDLFDVIQPNPEFGSIRLQYQNDETNQTVQVIKPRIKIYNDSGLDINLSDLTVRYWFTSEPSGSDTHELDWVQMGDEDDVIGTFDSEEDNYYLELSFSSDVIIPVGLGGDGSTPDLFPASSNTGEIHNRIRPSDWTGNYDQSDDYSWDSGITSYTDHVYINVYYKGQLVWGAAPSEPTIFYSRQNGNWDTGTSWSLQSHTGTVSTIPPALEDTVIVGGGHVITMTEAVTNDGLVTISDTGTLVTGSYILNGAGTFDLESGGTLRIGSSDGISASGSSGSIQSEGGRSFSPEANYVYNGSSAQSTGDGLPETIEGNLTIQNSAGVTAHQSYRVNGTLNLTSGTFLIGNGLSLIANTKNVGSGDLTYQLTTSSQPGYRLISSPIQADFGNLLSEVLTQGFTGASLAGDLQPNVLWYDEAYTGTDLQRWRAPSNISNSVTAGRGYHVYLFGDVSGDSNYNDALPYTLEVKGQEFEGTGGEVDLNVTYTEEGDEGWNLVGNPFGAAIDWEHGSITKSNLDATIYIWNPDNNQYDTWNGVTGDITDGMIAPFQGFWVKANGENPDLVISREAKTIGGEYVGKFHPQESPMISIKAYHSEFLHSTAHLSFTEDGLMKMDQRDAYKLLPPPGVSNYLEIFSRVEEGDRLAINNLPRRFGQPIEIPIEINAFKDGFSVQDEIMLEITGFKNIPNGWNIELIHQQTGMQVPITGQQTIPISMSQMGGKGVARQNDSGYKVTTKEKSSHARFLLRIEPGDDADGLPGDFELRQNYPNPFAGSTALRFTLPVESFVQLEIYDISGRRVATIVDEVRPAGSYQEIWRAHGAASGLYLARLVTSDGVSSRKLTLVK